MSSLRPPERVNVLGVGISSLNLESAVSFLVQASQEKGNTGYVTVTGVHGVVESQHDPELKRIHNRSLLSTPDGMPMVWVGRQRGQSNMGRVYGPELMLEVSKESLARGLTHYYFGGAEGVAETLKLKLQERFGGLEVLGTFCPPFRPLNEEEEEAFVAEIQKARPHFLWIGLSTPKQERFMDQFLREHPDLTKDWDHSLILLGVGAAFDFHTGRVRQAPRFIQRSGFEWLFRLCCDPKRLLKRYAYGNSFFLSRIFPQLLGWKSYPMSR